jgi:hypothetical protein
MIDPSEHDFTQHREALRHQIASAIDSPTVAALADVFLGKSNLAKSLSEQIVDILLPRLTGIAQQAARIEQLEAALRDLGDQTAWVIENEDPPVYAVLTDDFDEHFSPDINKALRFSRREDAQAFIDYVGWTSPKPVEHMWVAPRAALAPEQDK